MLADWEKNERGNVRLTPLVSQEALVLGETIVALRLEVSLNPDQTHTDLHVVQMGMSVEQAQDLIARLQWSVDHILVARPTGPTN